MRDRPKLFPVQHLVLCHVSYTIMVYFMQNLFIFFNNMLIEFCKHFTQNKKHANFYLTDSITYLEKIKF